MSNSSNGLLPLLLALLLSAGGCALTRHSPVTDESHHRNGNIPTRATYSERIDIVQDSLKESDRGTSGMPFDQSRGNEQHSPTASDSLDGATPKGVGQQAPGVGLQSTELSANVTFMSRAFTTPTRSGFLQHPELTEVSGMISSTTTPGILYAINDSGNSATLYAMSDDGKHQALWRTDTRNRDWEDMAKVTLNGKHYLIIGDTGDNLKIHAQSTLHLFEEPSLTRPLQDKLSPDLSIRFTYEDGPRNVEAFAVTDNTLYLISKEPVTASGAQASRLYTLSLAEQPAAEQRMARFAAELPTRRPTLEARLAASLAGVDLNHPTALDFDASGQNAYVLTYRDVIRYTRGQGQTWPEAFAQSGTRIHAHQLEQAEALAVDSGRAVFFTSEHASAPVWALPVNAPL